MNTIQGKRLTLGIAAACMGLQVALLAASPHVFATPHKQHTQRPQEVSETLSWYEAQQRKYQRQQNHVETDSATLTAQQPPEPLNGPQKRPSLSADQEIKMLTMMRLLTLDFTR